MKKFLANFVVLLVTVAVSLVLCEFAARLFLNPSDFLRLEVVNDPILGAVPSPSALAGFDKWGFRNRNVPDRVDIVAVGDSHTYGNTARMVDAWPFVLGQLSGQKVYNMGLGGYGPNQYFYLSNNKAFQLKPKTIIWGLYMGDDFENAFTLTYGLDYWKSLRVLSDQKVEANIWETGPGPETWHKKIRTWLSRHSILYQLIFHTGFGGRVKGDVQIENAAQLYPGVATSLIVPDKHIKEAFRPRAVLFGLDQDDPHVREGMRITFELLKQMNENCRKNNVQFGVVVIPTKEMVFAGYLENNPQIPMDDWINKLLANERIAREQLFKFMSDQGIPYVDPLPDLRNSIGQGLYAASAGDMHPNKNGYHVIGEAVAAHLKEIQNPPSPASAPDKK